MNIISVENAFLKYPAAKDDTIKGVSFDTKPGEIFGFLGPSGAGKSTLQKMLTGVLRKYRGSVRVFGNEMRHRTGDYYEKIGVDFEFPNFYNKFTALENLTYFSSLYAINQKTHRTPNYAAHRAAHHASQPALQVVLPPTPQHLSKHTALMDILTRVGLQNDAHKKVATFSKGMKMRLGFVRCLLHNPSLLFLDEPTGGLDPANARIIKDMILEQKQMGKTIILTTHNMHDAEELCDRVAFIVDGKIKAMDTPHTLRTSAAHVETKVEYCFIENGAETKKTCLLADLGHSDAFQSAMKAGTLTAIHSKEQTLEEVFIALTGRCLQ